MTRWLSIVVFVCACAQAQTVKPVVVQQSPTDAFVSYWVTRLEERAPAAPTWRQFCGALDLWPALTSEHFGKLDHALLAWPDELRRAPDRWNALDAPLERPVWRLVRAIDVAPDDAAALAGALPHLAHVTWVDVDGPAPLAALSITPALPKLAHVRVLASDLPSVRSLAEERGAALVTLDLWENDLGPELTQILTARPWPSLRTLDIGANKLDGPSAAVLENLVAPQLESLVIGFNTIGDDGFLHALRGAPSLVSLDARASGLTSETLQGMHAQYDPRSLESLDLSDNALTDEGVALVADFVRVGLKALRLNHVGATPRGVAALAAGFDHGLRVLELSRNELGDAGVKPICTPGASSLHYLKLDSVQLGNDAARALAFCPHLANLRSISLHTNGAIDAVGVRSLAEARWSQLYAFGLDGCSIGDAGFTELIKAPWWAQLTHLRLEGNGFTDAIASELQLPPNLQNLGLGWNELRTPTASVLAAQSLDKITTMSLRGNAFDDSALRELADAAWLARLEELDLRSLAFDQLALSLDAIQARMSNHGTLRRDQ